MIPLMDRFSRLLKSDVLPPVEEVQGADWRVAVAVTEQKRLQGLSYATCAERVGRIPALANQCREYVIVGANEDDIGWIAVCAPPVTGAAGQHFKYLPQLIDRQVPDLTRLVNVDEIAVFVVEMTAR